MDSEEERPPILDIAFPKDPNYVKQPVTEIAVRPILPTRLYTQVIKKEPEKQEEEKKAEEEDVPKP